MVVFRGDKCSFGGALVVFRGDKCSFGGALVVFRGDKCSFGGALVVFRGDKCSFGGALVVFRGDKCSFGGARKHDFLLVLQDKCLLGVSVESCSGRNHSLCTPNNVVTTDRQHLIPVYQTMWSLLIGNI